MKARNGFSLIEALAAIAIVGLVLAVTVPNMHDFERRTDMARLARQIAADALRCRMEALVSCRNVGLVFSDVEDRSYYVMVADGDNDGVSRADYLRGVDKPLGPKVWVHFLSLGARLGVPASWSVPDPSGGGTIDGRGLRIGTSGIISFSHTGGATPSSVYFNDGHGRLLVVRVSGEHGRIRALTWCRGWAAWHEIRLCRRRRRHASQARACGTARVSASASPETVTGPARTQRSSAEPPSTVAPAVRTDSTSEQERATRHPAPTALLSMRAPASTTAAGWTHDDPADATASSRYAAGVPASRQLPRTATPRSRPRRRASFHSAAISPGPGGSAATTARPRSWNPVNR